MLDSFKVVYHPTFNFQQLGHVRNSKVTQIFWNFSREIGSSINIFCNLSLMVLQRPFTM